MKNKVATTQSSINSFIFSLTNSNSVKENIIHSKHKLYFKFARSAACTRKFCRSQLALRKLSATKFEFRMQTLPFQIWYSQLRPDKGQQKHPLCTLSTLHVRKMRPEPQNFGNLCFTYSIFLECVYCMLYIFAKNLLQ